MSQVAKMPPLASVLKSRDVEDPVNIFVERPLAYLFAWSIFKTPITPNMVTFFSLIAGVMAGVMFVWGTGHAMIAGGLLLWASAIFDGADGILARAKNQQSQFGRALDGTADGIVAGVTVFAAFYHIWVTTQSTALLWLMPIALVTALSHVFIYDYFKELFLRETRLERGGEGTDHSAVLKLAEPAKEQGLLTYIAVKHFLIPQSQTQQKLITFVDPGSLREGTRPRHRSELTAEIYRRNNYVPMQLWAFTSLAPHAYLMAFCAVFDQLVAYLWIRAILMNVVAAIAIVWQRRATERTRQELEAIGAIESRPDESRPFVAHAA